MLLWIALLALTRTAQSTELVLPYTTRTEEFSGWSSTVRGDIRMVGMAGAVVGLGDSVVASGENPAGLAMTFENTSLQITANRIQDGDVQDRNEAMSTINLGGATPAYPWGFSVGFFSPQSEGQPYRIGTAAGTQLNAQVHVREYRISVARIFFSNRLALGMSGTIAQADKSLEFPFAPALSNSHHSYALGATLGAMYQLPGRWLIGASHALPIDLNSNPADNPSIGVATFHRSVRSPSRFALGLGWIPNRFFRAGFSVYLIGTTQGVALLRDDTRRVGQDTTIQPRLGANYLLAELKDLKIETSAGTYFEVSRIAGTPSRLHLTAGLEVNPWIFNLGWGIDTTARYANNVFAFAIDLVRLVRKLELIPLEAQAPYGGFFPRLAQLSDDGLARPLVKNWKETKGESILETVRKVPERFEAKIEKTGEAIKDLGRKALGTSSVGGKKGGTGSRKAKPRGRKKGAPSAAPSPSVPKRTVE